MARNGRNTVIYKGTFVSNHSLEMVGKRPFINSKTWASCSMFWQSYAFPNFEFNLFFLLLKYVNKNNLYFFLVLPEVAMAATEVESAIFRFMSSLGQGTDWDPEEFDSICEMIPAFKFGILVTGENCFWKTWFILKNYKILKYGSQLRVSFLYKCSPLLSLLLCLKNKRWS